MKEVGGTRRASQPAGFELYECWGEFLDFENRMSLDLFDQNFDGVRIMAKFNEYLHSPRIFQKWVNRAWRAKDMGKKLHLCIDWHNTATGPNDYHTGIEMPTLNKIAKTVGEIIKEFPTASILEVANEPYYTQKAARDKMDIKTYAALVDAYVTGASIGNFAGKILASQTSRRNWKKGDIHDGWEWHATRWNPGMLEGLHSAVLHDWRTPEGLWAGISDHWYNGRAVGYQWPIYESECAPGGKHVPTNSPTGAEMMTKVLTGAKAAKLPVCLLTIRGDVSDYGAGGNWAGAMHLVNAYEELSFAGWAIYKFRGNDVPTFDDKPTDPPVDPPTDPPEEPDVPDKPTTAKQKRERFKRQINDHLPDLLTHQLRLVRDLVRELAR